MKTDDCKEKLLEDVLSDDSFFAFNSGVKAKALGKLQQRVRLRRMRPLILLAVLTITLTFHSGRSLRNLANKGTDMRMPLRTAMTLTKNSEEAKSISDEELLSLFPPGTCTLAEVNGETKLIFFEVGVWNHHVSNFKPGI